jgi:hypothetical protein
MDKKYGYAYTVVISGANMSFKSGQLIDGFALPGYTKRGIHYERFSSSLREAGISLGGV